MQITRLNKNLFIAMCVCLVSFIFIVNNCLANEPTIISQTASEKTVRFYAGNGDGVVWMGEDHSWTDWDITHNALVGDYVFNHVTAYTGSTYWSWGTKTPAIFRAFIPINTSELPDSAEILKASINFYVVEIIDIDNDGDDWVNIVNTSQNNNSTLIYDDYDQCGSTHNAVEGANRVDLSNVVINSNVEFELNVEGINWIAKDGFSYFGLREGHDILDKPLEKYLNNRFTFSTSEEPDINKRPYLEVTYTVPDEKEPVILVPGIMGSWDLFGQWELDPILHTYDDLWEALQQAGYEAGKDLFAFPYQWRYSNTVSAIELKEKIQAVKNISGSDKVDIVAHSMGGLVSRSYIEGSDYDNDVDQLIFLATPHQGATAAYLTWEGGEFGPGIKDRLMEYLFEQEAHTNYYRTVFEYVQNFPLASLQELLPVYDYIMEANKKDIRVYSDNYPRNVFLEMLNNNELLQNLNSVEIHNFVGQEGEGSTIDTIRVTQKKFKDGRWEHGYPYKYNVPFSDHGLIYGQGDGTVPARSNLNFFETPDQELESGHNEIVTDSQKEVIKILTGNEPVSEVRSGFIKKLLLIRIFSPVDLAVITPGGARVGKDFLNSTSTIEVDRAFYTGFEAESEFATIPDPESGQYRIELEGVNEGEYLISLAYIEDNNSTEISLPGVIMPGQPVSWYFNFAEGNDGSLSFDPGSFEKLIYDLHELNLSGEIYREFVYHTLLEKFIHLKDKFEKFTDKENKSKDNFLTNAKHSIRATESRLRHYLNMGWVSGEAYDLLYGDLEEVLKHFM